MAIQPNERATLKRAAFGYDDYELYTADSEKEAVDYLNRISVMKSQYYVVIETPGKIVAKDRVGIFYPSNTWRGNGWYSTKWNDTGMGEKERKHLWRHWSGPFDQTKTENSSNKESVDTNSDSCNNLNPVVQSDKNVIFRYCFIVGLICYLISGLFLVINPGEIFTDWFHSIRTSEYIHLCIWDSESGGEKLISIIFLFFPFIFSKISASISSTLRKGVNTFMIFYLAYILVCLGLSYLFQISQGGDNAVSESLREIAKFLGIGYIPGLLVSTIIVKNLIKQFDLKPLLKISNNV